MDRKGLTRILICLILGIVIAGILYLGFSGLSSPTHMTEQVVPDAQLPH